MVKDELRTKKQLIDELNLLRKQVDQVKALETECKEELAVSEIQYKRLFETAQEGILILDGVTGQIKDVNEYLTNMLECSRDEVLGKSLWEINAFIDPHNLKRATQDLTEKNHIHYGDLALETKTGRRIDVELVSNVYSDNSNRVIQCHLTDVTERKRLEREIRLIATHDTMTDLPNRTLLRDRIHIALMHAQRNNKKVAVMSLHLDKFSAINATYGDNVGNKLLKAAAERLTSTLRRSDTVARVGGDEFALVLPEMDDIEHVITVAQKILEQFRQHFIISGNRIIVTVSIGIATSPQDGKDVDTLLNNADKAMYRVRAASCNNYEFSSN